MKVKLNTENKFKNHTESLLEWNKKLVNPFNKNYFKLLDTFLNKGSAQGKFHHKTNEIFKAFEFVDPNNVPVVIMSDTSHISTGLPYGSMLTSTGNTMNNCIDYIENAIERDLRKGFNMNFDSSLESWAMQNVLLLNTNYTYAPGYGEDYSEIWKKFNTKIIQSLNINRVGIHFVFLGRKSNYYNSLINKAKHWTYLENRPEEKKSEFNVKFMESINEKLRASNGKESEIQWHKYI
jgi:uracil DNA glycosylase